MTDPRQLITSSEQISLDTGPYLLVLKDPSPMRPKLRISFEEIQNFRDVQTLSLDNLSTKVGAPMGAE